MRIVGWLQDKSTLSRGYFEPLQARLRSWRGVLPRSFAHRREVATRVGRAFSNSFLVAGISITGAAAVLFLVPIFTSPFYWLPEPKDSLSLLGPLVGAQAAVAALTLAVTVFVVQGVTNKDDADDRTYREYVHRSQAEWVLWSSLGAAAITAAVLVGHRLISQAPAVLDAAQGLPNLTLVAVAALLGNLVLPGVLFRRAISLARPDQWRALRLDADKRDIRAAVHVFLGRYRRAAAALEADEPDLANLFPDPGEDAGNEAIRTVLGDARRAMAERKYGDFTRSLDAIKELVEHAMDELEREGVPWERPGSQPQWPPLHRLDGDLYSFREEVIGRGDRDYVLALLVLDHWLLTNGTRRRCGELFTTALAGYRWNYEVASWSGSSELRDLLRDRLWNVADGIVYGETPQELFAYARQLVKHQELVLADALLADRPDDFERLHRGFSRLLRTIRRHWDVDSSPSSASVELYQELAQTYRIALMGLGGRAILLSESGTATDPGPYLDVAREEYADPAGLAADVAQALSNQDESRFSLWTDWEMEGAGNAEVRSVDPLRYPFTFFVPRLLELATANMPALDLGGRATVVLDWFEVNSQRLAPHAAAAPDQTMTERRDFAAHALRSAVRRDAAMEDAAVIDLKLDTKKVETFAEGVRASARATNIVQRVFARAGALLHTGGSKEAGPAPRVMSRLELKAVFAEVPKEHPTRYYGGPDGSSWGMAHASDVVELLCEALDDATTITRSLDTAADLLEAIDKSVDELGPKGETLVLLAGYWGDILFDLDEENGYEVVATDTPEDWDGVMESYRGHPIIRGPGRGNRRLYVLDPGAWGCLARSGGEADEELSVEVETISLERAQELLDANPDYFPDEPDEASKLRKLQTQVVITVEATVEFQVTDASRARKIKARA